MRAIVGVASWWWASQYLSELPNGGFVVVGGGEWWVTVVVCVWSTGRIRRGRGEMPAPAPAQVPGARCQMPGADAAVAAACSCTCRLPGCLVKERCRLQSAQRRRQVPRCRQKMWIDSRNVVEPSTLVRVKGSRIMEALNCSLSLPYHRAHEFCSRESRPHST